MKRLCCFLLLAYAVSFGKAGLAQESYQKPHLEQDGSWSMIMLPDLQNYVKWGTNQPILELMMAWIEDNIDTLNIQMVVCVGDLIQSPEKITNDYDGNRTTQQQWETVSKAFARLDGKVPYIAATGNHDYSIDREGNRTSQYNDFFTAERNHLNQKLLVQNSRDEQSEPTLANSAYELTLNGQDYLFMTIEYAPRDTVVTWAKRIADMEQYQNHRIVLVTHNYLNAADEHTTGAVKWLFWEPYAVDNMIQKSPGIPLTQANNGKQVWEKLVRPARNVELVLSGHISGEGYRMDKNEAGRSVHQILFDAQSMGGGHRDGNGGDGWLRILEFLPDNKTVKVKTFSPLFGISPTTRQFAWKRDPRNEFIVHFDEH